MKFTKTLSLILAICIMMAVCSFGMLSASAEDEEIAEEGATFANGDFTMPAYDVTVPTIAGATYENNVSGGWEFSDLSANSVTDGDKELLAKALEGLAGVSYEAKEVIATQTVAGTNYAFLCVATPVVANPEPYWAVVTVYVDLQGKAEFIGAKKVEITNIATLENAPEAAAGAWTPVEKTQPLVINDSITAAFSFYTGVDLVPIALFGTQLVSGTNYRMLAYGTTVTAQPVPNLYVVDIYTNLDGVSEISSVKLFDLVYYISEPAAPEETEAATGGEKSPQTGHTSNVSLAIVLILIAFVGAGASVYAIAKKRG